MIPAGGDGVGKHGVGGAKAFRSGNLQEPARYLVSVPDNGDSRWSRYGLPAL